MAERLEDLWAPPNNRLELLKGDRAGQFSIRINDIVRQRRAVTVDTALRLGRFFGVSAEFWMGLQANFDMARARDALAAERAAIDPWQAQQPA